MMESDRKSAVALPPVPPSATPSTVNGPSNAFSQARPMHGRLSGPTRRSTRGQWTPEEDEILRAAVHRYQGKNWKKIAESFKDRSDVQCLHRWQKVLNPDLVKGPWSKEEDEMIVQLVKKFGPKKWSTIAQHLPGRIGKQCRERWHNHLNPGINKEAWTQEEELVLIHAHQMYGNKWAELTKYLPGRTDNSIKNHWNSSVKKKLDSYKASGLLSQLQGLTLIAYQNQPMPLAAFNGDGSFFKDGADGEEISECSQAGCSQTASDMSNAVGQTREVFVVSEESDHGKLQSASPSASCSEQHYTSLDDMTFTIAGIPCEFTCSSTYLEDNFSEVPGSGVRDCSFGAISLPMNSSSDMAANSCQPDNYFLAGPSHNSVPGPPDQSTEYNVVTTVSNCCTDVDGTGQMLRAEEGCSQIILTQEDGDGNFERCSDMIDSERYRDYMSFQSIYGLSEADGTSALQPYNFTASVLEALNCDDQSSSPSKISVQNGLTKGNETLGQINDSLPGSHGEVFVSNAENGCVNISDNYSSPCHGPSNPAVTEQTDLLHSSRLVPDNTCVSEMSNDQQTATPKVERPPVPECKKEVGTLCYEPPRFPSLDIPFFSCDLAQSGTDAQHDFSPLGIRQFMSSASSLTPFKLWDSPPSDDSPDALLKSAAKTFARTPSILKKRHRDLLSPLSPFSERRFDKKTGSDVNQGFLCTSRLTKEFSRLDVIFDDAVQCKESATLSSNQIDHPNSSNEDKENICPSNHNQEIKARTPEKDTYMYDLNIAEEGTPDGNSKIKGYDDSASETPRGVLVERHLNNLEFSPPVGIRPNTSLDTSYDHTEVASLKNTLKEAAIAAENFVSPPSFDHTKRNYGSGVSSGQPVSAVTTAMVDSLVNEVGSENLNFFGGTPFRRNMESPSAWKSPWYFSSLVSCPRFEPDITIEDIGIFMSPGERSYDAIGLMKQINEQGADAYADAREVLGSETPETILRQRYLKRQNLERDCSPLEGRLHRPSNVVELQTERRVLDFSECGTPVKSMEKMECVGFASLPSPC